MVSVCRSNYGGSWCGSVSVHLIWDCLCLLHLHICLLLQIVFHPIPHSLLGGPYKVKITVLDTFQRFLAPPSFSSICFSSCYYDEVISFFLSSRSLISRCITSSSFNSSSAFFISVSVFFSSDWFFFFFSYSLLKFSLCPSILFSNTVISTFIIMLLTFLPGKLFIWSLGGVLSTVFCSAVKQTPLSLLLLWFLFLWSQVNRDLLQLWRCVPLQSVWTQWL